MPKIGRHREAASFSLPLELLAALRWAARREGKPLSHVVERALKAYLQRERAPATSTPGARATSTRVSPLEGSGREKL